MVSHPSAFLLRLCPQSLWACKAAFPCQGTASPQTGRRKPGQSEPPGDDRLRSAERGFRLVLHFFPSARSTHPRFESDPHRSSISGRDRDAALAVASSWSLKASLCPHPSPLPAPLPFIGSSSIPSRKERPPPRISGPAPGSQRRRSLCSSLWHREA